MGFLKGPVSDGVVQVQQKVNFTKSVQNSNFSPWIDEWYVDETGGDDTHNGQGASEAKETIQAAVTAAGRGDVVYVRPLAMQSDGSDVERYDEQVTVPYATSQLSLIGISPLTQPNYGVKIKYNSGYVVDVYASGFHMENITAHASSPSTGPLFLRGETGYTTKSGSCGASIYGCLFRYYQVHVDGGYNNSFVNCTWHAAASGLYFDGQTIPSKNHLVKNCDFTHNSGSAIATYYLGGWGMNGTIKDCTFGLLPTDAHFIHLSGSNEGGIFRCSFNSAGANFGTDDGTSEIYIAGGGMTVNGCTDASGEFIKSS